MDYLATWQSSTVVHGNIYRPYKVRTVSTKRDPNLHKVLYDTRILLVFAVPAGGRKYKHRRV